MSMSRNADETPKVSGNASTVIGSCIRVGRVTCQIGTVVLRWLTPGKHPNLYISCLVGSMAYGSYTPWLRAPFLVKNVGQWFLSCGFRVLKNIRSSVVAVAVIGLTGWHCYYAIKPFMTERNYSALLQSVTHRNPALREPFYQQLYRLPLIHMPYNHTHAESAELRSSANYFLKNMVRSMGYDPYCVSNANSDSGEKGCRYFYCVKDLKLNYRDDIITENSMLIFTDVDYHAPMNEYLKLWKPMVLYTLYPTSVTGHGLDYTYKIKDNRVVYHVSGGANYEHNIWDYDNDIISIIDDDWNLLTFDVTMTALEKDPHRRIVTIFPSAKVPWPYYKYLDYNDGIKFKEFTIQAGKLKVNWILDPIRKHLSLSLNDSFNSVEIDSYIFDGIIKRLEAKKSPPMIADIERLLIAQNTKNKEDGNCIIYKEPATQAALLFDIASSPFVPIKNNVPTFELKCSYQTMTFLATEDGKDKGLMFTHPIVTQPAVFPSSSVNNDVATIQGRINKPRLNKLSKPPTRFNDYAKEFVDYIVPDRLAGTGVPYTYDEVVEIQNRPMQKARSAMAEITLTPLLSNSCAGFMKEEAYNGTNFPRNITTCSTQLTISGSTFTYPFKYDVLKHFKWYGPGLTPLETVNRLGEICTTRVIPSDYAKLDGTLTEFLQFNVVRACYMRYYGHEYKKELSRCFKELFKQIPYKTSNGVAYMAGYGTRSGSPWTSCGNTLCTSYNVYCAYREMGYSIEQAFEAMNRNNLQFSDDGVARDVPGFAKAIKETSTLLGLDIEIEYNDGIDVPYLGRIFVQPSFMVDSYQNPRRTLPKIHTTGNKTVEIMQAAFNKVSGYLTTDALTPVINIYCNKVQELCGITEKRNLTTEELYKEQNCWPQENADAIRESFLRFMDWNNNDLSQVEAILANVTDMQGFTPIWDNDDGTQPNKIGAVIDDTIVGPAPVLITTEPELCKTQSNLKQPVKTGKEGAKTTSKLRSYNTKGKQKHSKRKDHMVGAKATTKLTS